MTLTTKVYNAQRYAFSSYKILICYNVNKGALSYNHVQQNFFN